MKQTNAGIMFGVSSGTDAMGGWHVFRQRVDTNGVLHADQPTLGFNKDLIVVQANMVPTNSSSVQESHFYVFDKTNAYAGNFCQAGVRPCNGAELHDCAA